MTRKPAARPGAHARAALALLLLALGAAGLGVYQWVELRVVESGGKVVCSISQSVNCETVWTSPLAQAVRQAVGFPVAGLGILWGLVGAAAGGWLYARSRRGRPIRDEMGAVRVTALVGLLATVLLAAGSVNAGALCLTCLATYALVVAFAALAFVALPRPWAPRGGEWWTALGLPSVSAILAYGLLLVAGRSLPSPATSLAQAGFTHGGLQAYLAQASPVERQALSDTLAVYRTQSIPGAFPPERNRLGAASAPVKVVEWTDIRCGHCRHFNDVLENLRAVLPPDSLAVEVRNFPLDGRCNPLVPEPGPGVSCDGALALICLEHAPDFWSLREKLFAAQHTLTSEKILEIATSTYTVTRPELEACMHRADTRARLVEDIQYAQLYNPTGTPVISVNGRLAPASGPLLYVLAMSAGNPDAPALASLPPPRHTSRQ
jgi:protein-disulfide isomerase